MHDMQLESQFKRIGDFYNVQTATSLSGWSQAWAGSSCSGHMLTGKGGSLGRHASKPMRTPLKPATNTFAEVSTCQKVACICRSLASYSTSCALRKKRIETLPPANKSLRAPRLCKHMAFFKQQASLVSSPCERLEASCKGGPGSLKKLLGSRI